MSSRRRQVKVVEPAISNTADILRQSGLFDVDWYQTTYPDIKASGIDPVEHYIASGVTEGRNPNPFFDTAWYVAANEDVRLAGINPLQHYIKSGAAEGRGAGPDFDTAYYVAQNPDIGLQSINPLLHYLHHGQYEGRMATPYDEGEAFEVAVRAKQQGLTGPAAALFQGSRGDHLHFALQERQAPRDDGSLPLPPLRLAKRIGSLTLEDFDSSGQAIRNTIIRALPEGFSWSGSRCLDFGSDLGRTLRYFGDEANHAEFWGCAFDSGNIRWSVQNLHPPFHFFQINEVPAIPFEDNSFDLVYAISIFSHIHAAWNQWLMEIRRVLKPGATFFVSFMGQNAMEEMLGESSWKHGSNFGMYVKRPYQSRAEGGPLVFVSPDWIKTFLGSMFDIEFIVMDGLLDNQSFCVMKKPSAFRPEQKNVPVLQLNTAQVFNPGAIGRIIPQVNEQMHYLKSYGLDVKVKHNPLVEGWIAFRNDSPDQMEVLVDDRRVPAVAEFKAGASYRDWENSPCASFSVSVNLSLIKPGIHKLQTRIRSTKGLLHTLTIPLIIRREA